MDEEKSKQIKLEYKVEFEDGLKKVVCIYGIDSENKKVHSVLAFISVDNGANDHIKSVDESVKIGPKFIPIGISNSIDDLTENWEQEIYEKYRKSGWNLVKVQNPEDVEPAIYQHLESYGKELRGRVLEIPKSSLRARLV